LRRDSSITEFTVWMAQRQADRDAADIEGVKSVDILGGIDRRDHPVGIDLRRHYFRLPNEAWQYVSYWASCSGESHDLKSCCEHASASAIL
jgi:hypothetical protein